MEMNLFFRISFLILWALLGVVRGYYGRKTKTHDSLVGIKEKLNTSLKDLGKGFMILTAIVTLIGAVGLVLYLFAPLVDMDSTSSWRVGPMVRNTYGNNSFILPDLGPQAP
jgi:hypothetical protein